jgi:hypothetical protein
MNNELTGRVNSLTDAVNVLTDTVNQITSRNNELTGTNNSLVEANNNLMAEVNRLVAVADALVFERESMAMPVRDRTVGSVDTGPAPSAAAKISRPSSVVRPRTAKFLIVSNQRSGSTWLETMLGALPDAATDYEFKWDINYAPLSVHRVLSNSSPTVSEVLAELDDEAPIVGSKLVFDHRALSGRQLQQLWQAIGDDVKLVHLTRSYQDVLLSRRRGVLHKIRGGKASKIGKNLRDELEKHGKTVGISTRAASVSPLEVCEELMNYLRNDLSVSRLQPAAGYLRIDYESVEKAFPRIAEFIGSAAGEDILMQTVVDSPTVKLPQVSPQSVLSNFAELQDAFAVFESLRRQYLPSML